MSQKPSMNSFWNIKKPGAAAAPATSSSATNKNTAKRQDDDGAGADEQLSGARRERGGASPVAGGDNSGEKKQSKKPVMLLDDDDDDDDVQPAVVQEQQQKKEEEKKTTVVDDDDDDPFAAAAAAPHNAAAAAAAAAVAAHGEGGEPPLTLARLNEYLEDLSDENAVSMAELYQDDDGQNYFQTVFKQSFEMWPHGEPCPYRFWCDVLADVSSISSRNVVTRRLAFGLLTIFLRGTPQDAVQAIYLCINELAPAHEGTELGVADGTIVPTVATVCGLDEKKVREEYKKTGDLAEVAQKHKKNLVRFTAPKKLMLGGVFSKFKQIAETKGEGSQKKRQAHITSLLRDAEGCEVNFLIRALQGKMRIGVALKTLNAALGHALALRTLITLHAIEPANKKAGTAGNAQTLFFQKVTFTGPGGPGGEMQQQQQQQNNKKRPYDDDDFPFMAPWAKRRIDTGKLMKLLKNFAESVGHAYHQFPVIDELIATICNTGRAALPSAWLKKFSIRAGVPVKPMLAHPTTSIKALLDRFNGKAFTTEYKYDGERGQVHFVRGGVSPGGNANLAPNVKREFEMYSRNSESYTTKFPDVIRGLPEAFRFQEEGKDAAAAVAADDGNKNKEKEEDKNDDDAEKMKMKDGEEEEEEDGAPVRVDSFIMDGEVVAVEEGTGRLRPFQVLQSRGKKNVDADQVSCRVRYFAFDLLMLNGESLLSRPLRERRRLLHRNFTECHMFTYAKGKDSDDVDEIQTFLDESVSSGCEGLMVKTLDEVANYQPSQRSHFWLKLKKDYMEGCGDTLDLVCVGAYWGVGKRAGKYGGFLLACYNDEEGVFETVCKCGTGFSDEDFTNYFRDLETQEEPAARCPDVLKPDVWIVPKQVWEVKAADLSLSPVHSSGIALRFPRHMKRREDKETTDATTSDQVMQMYKSQALVQAEAAAAGPKDMDDDEY